jgi:hypothetical protein
MQMGNNRYGAVKQQGSRRPNEGLSRLDWKEKDLPVLSKGDKRKMALARQLPQETTVSLKWIAEIAHGQLDLRLQPVA